MLAAASLSVLLDLTLMRPVYRQTGEERTRLGLLLTLGLAFVIVGLLNWKYPTGALYIFVGGDPISVAGVPMSAGSIWASAIALRSPESCCCSSASRPSARGSLRDPGRDRRASGRHQPVARADLIFALSGGLARLVAVTRSMTAPLTVTAGSTSRRSR